MPILPLLRAGTGRGVGVTVPLLPKKPESFTRRMEAGRARTLWRVAEKATITLLISPASGSDQLLGGHRGVGELYGFVHLPECPSLSQPPTRRPRQGTPPSPPLAPCMGRNKGSFQGWGFCSCPGSPSDPSKLAAATEACGEEALCRAASAPHGPPSSLQSRSLMASGNWDQLLTTRPINPLFE